MTVVVDVGFDFGYVHATPWSTHVNEGAVEWPISPWRFLRSLVAVWHTRVPELSSDIVGPLLAALAEPPDIKTAPRTEASIRTYLPSDKHRHGTDGETDLVIDAFAAVAPGHGLSYRWGIDLDETTQAALTTLTAALPYLGRAESVCTATTRFEDVDGQWIEPTDDETGQGQRTLTPVVPLVLDDLCVSIPAMRRGGRLHPPGARWVRYDIPPPLRSASSRRRTAKRARENVTAVRLAMRSGAPITVHKTLVVAEVMRAAAMSRFGWENDGGASPTLAGKDADGRILGHDHQHAHWLPLDLDGDRLLDTIVAWAPGGFGEAELEALSSVSELRFHGNDGLGSLQTPKEVEGSLRRHRAKVSVALEALGGVDDLDLGGAVGAATAWRAVTPFLPARHHHRDRQSLEEFLTDCVGRELRHRGVNEAFTLERDQSTGWGAYRRHRRAERLAQARSAHGFTIHFSNPLPPSALPILALGQLSHFGMGRFEPCP